MSDLCTICGIVTRGGACSEIDSRRAQNVEVARCPNADPERQQFARQAAMRDLVRPS